MLWQNQKYVQIQQQQQQQQQHTNHENKLQEYNERTLVFEVNKYAVLYCHTNYVRKKEEEERNAIWHCAELVYIYILLILFLASFPCFSLYFSTFDFDPHFLILTSSFEYQFWH